MKSAIPTYAQEFQKNNQHQEILRLVFVWLVIFYLCYFISSGFQF